MVAARPSTILLEIILTGRFGSQVEGYKSVIYLLFPWVVVSDLVVLMARRKGSPNPRKQFVLYIL